MLRAWPSRSSRLWNSRTKTGMRASAIVMHNPLPQNFPQVLFVQRDHPVQALAPHASDESFTISICLRLWSAKIQDGSFQINVTLLHPEDLETGLRFLAWEYC